MAKKLDEIIRKIIYGSTAALAASIPTNAEQLQPTAYVETNDVITSPLTDIKVGKEELILYRANTVPSDNTLFHRSHRSHSSHRSHYSSYSQPSQPAPKKDTSNQTKRTVQPRTPSQNQNTNETNLVNKFGSRQLSKGMKGTDVADLQSLLISKGYSVKITAAFDNETFEALKSFQKSKKIEATGQMDVLTLWYLQNEKK